MAMELKLAAIIFSAIAGIVAVYFLIRDFIPRLFDSSSERLARLAELQSTLGRRLASEGGAPALQVATQEARVELSSSTRPPLAKRLKYARWKISPLVFHCFEAAISLLCFALAAGHVSALLLILALAVGPLLMRGLLARAIEQRFKRFDADYPQFLMTVVGLLKTGMTSLQALDAAAQGLEADSLVRQEVRLTVERLKVGVTEERSIGSFGEDIEHPEIELFVQALLLSRRLGGNLAETLERIAKQARRRQYFRSSAASAISMQRASLWVIIAIMVSLEGFLAYASPDLVFKGMRSDAGWQVWQAAIVMVGISILWIQRITKIKV